MERERVNKYINMCVNKCIYLVVWRELTDHFIYVVLFFLGYYDLFIQYVCLRKINKTKGKNILETHHSLTLRNFISYKSLKPFTVTLQWLKKKKRSLHTP